MTEDKVPGITLEPSALGGLLVKRGGQTLGWMHERGSQWHAYLRVRDVTATGRHIGAYGSQAAAALAVVQRAVP